MFWSHAVKQGGFSDISESQGLRRERDYEPAELGLQEQAEGPGRREPGAEKEEMGVTLGKGPTRMGQGRARILSARISIQGVPKWTERPVREECPNWPRCLFPCDRFPVRLEMEPVKQAPGLRRSPDLSTTGSRIQVPFRL